MMAEAICPKCGSEFWADWGAVSEQHRDADGRYYIDCGCERRTDMPRQMSENEYLDEMYGDNGDGGDPPTIEQLMAWNADGGCEATDGCWVEPDGVCPHGCESWLMALGMI